MSIVKMSKMTLLGLLEDREPVIDFLMRSGAAQIDRSEIPPEQERASSAYADNLAMRARLAKVISGLQKLLPADQQQSLRRLTVSETDFAFSQEEEEELRALTAVYENLLAREESCRQRLSALDEQMAQLLPWREVPMDLRQRTTASTAALYGIFMDADSFDSLQADLIQDYPLASLYSLEKDQHFPAKSLLVTVKEEVPRLRARLASCAFHDLPNLPFTGTAAQTLASMEEESRQIEDQCRAIDLELLSMADRCGRLMTYHDFLAVRSDREAAGRQVHQLDYTFFLKVWIPSDQAEKTGRALAETFDLAWSSRPAGEGEDPPVKLKNNPLVRAFEIILEMYGAPNSRETDPMPVMAPFYMLLFGMMLSDVGYGALLVAGTAYMLFKKKVEGGVQRMSLMLFISGISSIIWGFVFGGFFGDMITALTDGRVNFPALWFNPMDSPVKLLLFSMIFGVIHLFFGLGIHIKNEKMNGNLIGGLADSVTWYLIIPGLGLLLGAGALSSDPARVALLKSIGQWVALAGAAFGLIFAGHGIRNPFKRLIKGLGALYGITSYLSDILSYARILALVLATSVIATVVNMLGMLGGHSVFGYILFVVIGLLGHGLNLALSALSSYVHTCRLQYVEMFGKFFVGGGSFWNPLRRTTDYVKIEQGSGTSQLEAEVPGPAKDR